MPAWFAFSQEIHMRMQFENRAAAEAVMAQLMRTDKSNPLQIAYDMIGPYHTRFDRWMQRHAVEPPRIDDFTHEIVIHMKSRSWFGAHIWWVLGNMALMMVQRPEGVFKPPVYPLRISLRIQAAQPAWLAFLKNTDASVEQVLSFHTDA